MLCPVCRGRVDLQATVCGCGFDFATREVLVVIERARRDRWKARLLLLAGLAGIGVCVAYGTFPYLAATIWSMGYRARVVVLGLPAITAIYGIGRGISLYRDAGRRLAIAEEMRQLPPARAVQRERERRGA